MSDKPCENCEYKNKKEICKTGLGCRMSDKNISKNTNNKGCCMIEIKKSKNADTRTCDWSKVDRNELLNNSFNHIEDVRQGMNFFATMVCVAGMDHDKTKITNIDEFHNDFKNGFKDGYTSWWKMHQCKERHHLKNPEFVQGDVNLIDVLEMITDGVMAGLARSGEYRKEEIPDSLLRKAFDNTIELLLRNVKVKDE